MTSLIMLFSGDDVTNTVIFQVMTPLIMLFSGDDVTNNVIFR